MNHAFKATAHENKIRRWQTFTPPQSTAHAAHCGLVLHWRAYPVLICQKPEFQEGLWALKHGDVKKNAWIMRDEFLNLCADPEAGWIWSVRQFLNKWGLWGFGQEYVNGSEKTSYLTMTATNSPITKSGIDRPGLVLVIPHVLMEKQESYRKALLPRNARTWLLSHPFKLELLEKSDEFPLFLLRRSYCTDAIDVTITIDHLAERQFGICKRCHKVFQKETLHKKSYCSERCFNAAGVQRWREKQRKAAKKGVKRNAKG